MASHWPTVDWGLPTVADDRLIATALEILAEGQEEEEDA